MVVQIPASPLAPHTVDGSYYGGNVKLGDPDVRRLIRERDQREETTTAALQEAIKVLTSSCPAGKTSEVGQLAVTSHPVNPHRLRTELSRGYDRWMRRSRTTRESACR